MSIFYLIFVMLTAYFSFRYDGIEEYDPHKQHRFWLMCFYLICLTGFSYGLGGDKFVYMREFEEYPDTFMEVGDYVWLQLMLKGQMPGWTLLNLVSRSVFHSFYALQLIQSAAINSAVCYVASKYTHRYFLFLLVYVFTLQYFVFNTEIMREGLALSFVLIGMDGWLSGKKWLYFVMLPLGLMFHVSALTALIFPFAQYFKASWKLFALACLGSFVIWALSDLLLGPVMMAVLGGMGAMVQKVLFYSIRASSIFGFARFIITFLVLPFIIMYSVMLHEQDEEKRRRMEHMIVYMLMLGVLTCSFVGFLRLYNYVRIFYLVLLTTFIYELFQEKKHLIIRCVTLLLTVFLILLQYFTHFETTNTYYYEFFYPYTCILDEDNSVYFREVAHEEAVDAQESDNNVREIN